MRGIGTVFAFTFRDGARRKSFIISTVIMAVVTALALCVPSLINQAQGSGKTSGSPGSSVLYLIDRSGLIGQVPDAEVSGYRLKAADPGREASLIDSAQSGSQTALAVVQEQGGVLSFDYYVHAQGDGPDPAAVGEVVRRLAGAALLGQSGVSAGVAKTVLTDVSYRLHASGRGMLSGYFAAIAVSLLLFMTIYLYGYWVASSIASEKTSRVMELLVTSTRPSRIVVGKSLAMGLLGLTQLAVVMVTAVVSYHLASPGSFTLGGIQLDFSVFTPGYAVVLVLYFLLGYALFAMLNAVAGATVSNAEDVRTAVMPVSMVGVVSFYFAYGTLLAPGSTAAEAASLIPFTAPFSMPSRMIMTAVPAWQVALSLALLALTAVVMTVVSTRLYSAAVLHYGKKLRLGELAALLKKS